MKKLITKEELAKTLSAKPVHFFAGLGVLFWLTGAFILVLPLVLYTLMLAIVFFPLWFIENKIKGDN